MERQDMSCMHLVHHELESILTFIVIIIVFVVIVGIVIITITNIFYYY